MSIPGPIKIIPTDDEGRRWPCPCHRVPSMLLFVTPDPTRGRLAYMPVSLSVIEATGRCAVENAMNTLEDMFEHPENYTS